MIENQTVALPVAETSPLSLADAIYQFLGRLADNDLSVKVVAAFEPKSARNRGAQRHAKEMQHSPQLADMYRKMQVTVVPADDTRDGMLLRFHFPVTPPESGKDWDLACYEEFQRFVEQFAVSPHTMVLGKRLHADGPIISYDLTHEETETTFRKKLEELNAKLDAWLKKLQPSGTIPIRNGSTPTVSGVNGSHPATNDFRRY